MSAPPLPAAPVGNDDDEANGVVRIMCEDIATSDTDVEDEDEARRLHAPAAIDHLPVGHRTELGQLLLNGLATARHVGDD